MNRLLEISFGKYGYDRAFLENVLETRYGGGFLFRDEGSMILALEDIRKSGRKIIIFPDFDMDGISAGAVLYAGLGLLGFDAEIYAPDVSRGYGISEYDIDSALKAWPDAEAIITCDVGITCGSAIAYAKSKGLTALVTDHHPEPDGKRVPADFIVDPSRSERECEFDGVCGAYVAYHIMTTYARLTGNEAVISLMSRLSVFAALGSCGDLMPVIHDTRKAILDGLREFNALLDADDLDAYLDCSAGGLPDAYAAPFENLRRLHFMLLRRGLAKYGDVTHVDLGFTYCPLFNSVKRMGGDMRKLYSLLYVRGGDDFDGLCDWLTGLNAERKALVAKLSAEMLDSGRDPAPGEPYLYIMDCVPGICGLLAMKVMERTGMPCIVACRPGGKGDYSGSGRMPDGFPKLALKHKGVRTEGHENAFGVSIKASEMEDYRNELAARVEDFAAMFFKDAADAPDPAPVVRIGAEAGAACDFGISSLEQYDECFEYAREIDALRPFGRGFAEPEHVLEFRPRDIMNIRTMGKRGEHLRVSLRYNIQMVLFGGTALYMDALEHGGDAERVYRFRGRFSVNEFNGSASLQFISSGAA